jgi:hypothetical protein
LVEIKSTATPIGLTVVGVPSHQLTLVEVSKDLTLSRPADILVTKKTNLKDLKQHLFNLWPVEDEVKNVLQSVSVNFLEKSRGALVVSTSEGGHVIPSNCSQFQLIESSEQALSPMATPSISGEAKLATVSVIGKNRQRPYRLTLIRTNGNIHEEHSPIRADLLVFLDTTVLELKQQVCSVWPDLQADPSLVASHVKFPVQLLFNGLDLIENDRTLAEYDILKYEDQDNNSKVNDETTRSIVVRSMVHLLVHQGRFINLQRYVWDQSKHKSQRLQHLSPLAAVSSVEELAAGILLNSSLSFTSKDCFRTFEEMKKIKNFPVSILEKLSPYNFFGKNERITLQRSKEYEDLLKTNLTELAKTNSTEIQQLLDKFALKSSAAREFNLCDMVLELKDQDMLPCLPFHLNTFEAIKLFQQLVADLEYRQKVAYPTHYMELEAEAARKKNANQKEIKSQGNNEKNVEELMKTIETVSSVDRLAPHEKFTVSKGSPISQQELDDLVEDMEKYDGFEKRDAQAMKEARGKNLTILNHALIRGLRRGVGLFIDEVSFPSYRRAIQKLASNGKLNVVISDGSLAFGVNMPFRTTIFCNEMRGTLDELMAQQMSGRAGRRGLDEQGNVIYAGVRLPMLKRLMIGKIPQITGRNQPAKYETMFLQAILSPRHTGFHRVEVLGGQSLTEFIDKQSEALSQRFSMTVSRNILMELGFIAATQDGHFIPNPRTGSSLSLLTAMWEMRNHIAESISLGMLFRKIMGEFFDVTSRLSLNDKKANKEKMEPLTFLFFVIIIQLVHRTPAQKHTTKLLDLPYFTHHEEHRVFFKKWEQKFADQQQKLRAHGLGHLCSSVAPFAELDGTFFQCVYDRNHIHSLDEFLKQDMKTAIWRVGSALKILVNANVIDYKFHRVGHFIIRNGFEKLKYLNSELIAGFINFNNVASADAERRTDTAATVIKPAEAEDWTDLYRDSWATAVGKLLSLLPPVSSSSLIPRSSLPATGVVVSDCSELRSALLEAASQGTSASTALTSSSSSDNNDSSAAEKTLRELADCYLSLDWCDLPFLRLSITASNLQSKAHIAAVVSTLATSSFVTNFPVNNKDFHPAPLSIDDEVLREKANRHSAKKISFLAQIGALVWYCHSFQPSTAKHFHLYLTCLYQAVSDQEGGEAEENLEALESALLCWEAMTVDQFRPFLPSAYKSARFVRPTSSDAAAGELTAEQFAEGKQKSAALLENIKETEEEEEEEDGDEEEED